MASTTLPPVTTSNSELYIQKAAPIVSSAFAGDAIDRYVQLFTHDLPNSTVLNEETRLQSFFNSIGAKVKAGVSISEAGDWGAVALWFPPGLETLFHDPDSLPAPLLELYDAFGKVKKRWLGERKYWYLNIVVRNPERSDPGLVRALITPYLEKAKEEGVPAWVEATTRHSRDVYAHLGFRQVEEIKIGEGKADQTGNRVAGGEGISMYCMIAEPNA